MKRAYDLCRKVGAFGLLPLLLFLRFSEYSRQHLLLFGFLFLPFTALSAATALLNHLLPPEQQDEIEVDWWLRIYHPYWDLFTTAFLNLLCFLSVLEPFPNSDALIFVLALLTLLAHCWGVGYAFWKKRQRKRQNRWHKRRN